MTRTVLLFVSLLLPLASAGQPPSQGGRDGGWFTIGAGTGDPHGTAIMTTANFGRARFAQVGLHASRRFNTLDTSPVLSAFHAGGGLSRVDRWSRLAVAVGPALVFERDDALAEHQAVGVLVNAQAAFTPIPEIGLGLDLYAHTSGAGRGYGLGVTLVFERNK